MYDLDLEKVNRSLVKAVQLVGAVRRMLDWKGEVRKVVEGLEMEIREAAVECQRVLTLMKEDESRPLLGIGGGD